eukprot:scaffold5708_cov378-Prasinococcus_capsulatus_cf.AAC.9
METWPWPASAGLATYLRWYKLPPHAVVIAALAVATTRAPLARRTRGICRASLSALRPLLEGPGLPFGSVLVAMLPTAMRRCSCLRRVLWDPPESSIQCRSQGVRRHGHRRARTAHNEPAVQACNQDGTDRRRPQGLWQRAHSGSTKRRYRSSMRGNVESSTVEGGERVGNTIALWLQYCGAGFSGWEAKSGARTVQGELEAAASELYGTAIGIVGASRTDAGVHACGQVAHMHVPR